MKRLLLIPVLSTLLLSSTPKYWEYFKEAGERYSVDPKLLLAIGMTESSLNHMSINKANRNKTIDVGVMQINSCHFKTLRKYTNNINALYDPRFNINIGAWVLRGCTKKFGTTWRAVDCYNKGAGNAHKNSRYIRKVAKNYKKVRYWELP